jgi:rubredoxin
MAGLWSKRFDHKNGENRVCKICGEEYHTMKPINRCRVCVNKSQKLVEEVRRAKYPKKETYPFDNRNGQSSSRFCSIRTALSKAWREYRQTGDKSIIIAHYNKQLKEAEELGILKWIYDRRTPEAKREINPYIKTGKMIKKDYPDTRGHYEY